MAKFCAYCGKPVEEGQECSCRQPQAPVQESPFTAPQQPVNPAPQGVPVQPQQDYQQLNQQFQQPYGQQAYAQQAKPAFDFNGFISGLMKTVLGIFAKPATTAKEFIDSKNFAAGIVMVGFNAIISAVFAMLFVLRWNISAQYSFSYYIKSVVLSFVVTLIFSLILSAAFWGMNVLTGILFKENYDFKAALCVAGIRSIVCVPTTIIALLVALIKPGYFALVIFYLGALVAALFVKQALSNVLVKTAQYQVYVNLVICVVMLILFYVLYKLGGNVYIPNLLNWFGF